MDESEELYDISSVLPSLDRLAISNPSLFNLPVELLVEIFSESDNPQLPLTCRHICDVVYSTPSFWTVIYLGEEQFTSDARIFLSARLERGKACLLDVLIRGFRNGVFDDIWRCIGDHRDRIRILDICTENVVDSGSILRRVLLTSPRTLPSLTKLNIRHGQDIFCPGTRDSPFNLYVLNSISNLLPRLTTLVLPLHIASLPCPTPPIHNLKTLVLDGSFIYHRDRPTIRYIAQLLANTPNLEKLWCKDFRTRTNDANVDLNTLPPLPDGGIHVHFPIMLSSLTSLAITVPGIGVDLLLAIEAPALRDLHLDGTRQDDAYVDEYQWLQWFPLLLHVGLWITSTRSPVLHRLSLVDAYLARGTWKWLLGCLSGIVPPFPLLDSIAVWQMEAEKGEVFNVLDDALIELYATQGQIALRRFAYLASDPPLSENALFHLINGVTNRKATDQVFEVELDGTFGIDTKEQLSDLADRGIRVILHEEPPQTRSWWTMGKDIDPMESDSY